MCITKCGIVGNFYPNESLYKRPIKYNFHKFGNTDNVSNIERKF